MKSSAGAPGPMPIGPMRPISATGSTNASTLPPPSANWSMANAASGVSLSGCATISTSTSAGTALMLWSSGLTSKNSRICAITACGGNCRGPPIIAIGLAPPSSGSPVISPTTRFFGCASV